MCYILIHSDDYNCIVYIVIIMLNSHLVSGFERAWYFNGMTSIDFWSLTLVFNPLCLCLGSWTVEISEVPGQHLGGLFVCRCSTVASESGVCHNIDKLQHDGKSMKKTIMVRWVDIVTIF